LLTGNVSYWRKGSLQQKFGFGEIFLTTGISLGGEPNRSWVEVHLVDFPSST